MTIVHLNCDDMNELEYASNEERNQLILNHPNREEYSVGDFVRAFNSEYISDLATLVLVDDKGNIIAS
jgi:hypothetical protein